jgi:putative ABC transport system permease protein
MANESRATDLGADSREGHAGEQGSALQAFLYALQECLRSALGSIRAHGLRSFLTMLGVIIGVASVICVVALLQGLTQSVMSELQGLGGNTLQVVSDTPLKDRLRGKTNRLRPGDMDQIRHQIGGISNLTPFFFLPASGGIRSGSNTTAAQVFASTTYFQFADQIFARYGRFIAPSDNDTSRRVAVLGEQARIDLKLPEDPTGAFIQLGTEWFKVVGATEPRGEMFGQSQDNYVIIPYETGLALSSQDVPPDIAILLTVDDIAEVANTTSRIKALMRRLHNIGPKDEDDFKIESSQSVAQTVERISTTVTLVVAAVVGISLLVGGVGIMNIMLVSVTERTREIGIAKALGAPRHYILMQFLIEAILLAVLGGLMGIALGYVLSLGAASLIPNFPAPSVPWWAILGATGFSALVGVIFGLLPASKAANLAPIDALRHE